MSLWSLSGGFFHFRFLATAGRWTKFHLKSPMQWLSLMILAYCSRMLMMIAEKLYTRYVFLCALFYIQSHQRDFILR
jgi:hypothetical protein